MARRLRQFLALCTLLLAVACSGASAQYGSETCSGFGQEPRCSGPEAMKGFSHSRPSFANGPKSRLKWMTCLRCAPDHSSSHREACRIGAIVFASPWWSACRRQWALGRVGGTHAKPNPPFPGQYRVKPSACKADCFDGTDKRAFIVLRTLCACVGPWAARPRRELNLRHTASQARICTFGREPMVMELAIRSLTQPRC